jgi:hypothetical protein
MLAAHDAADIVHAASSAITVIEGSSRRSCRSAPALSSPSRARRATIAPLSFARS